MTQQRQSLVAQKRDVLGRKVKQLRNQGKTPGHIFSKGADSVSVSVNSKELEKVYAEAGETALVDLTVEGEGKALPVLIRGIDRHPVNGSFLHVDFQQVNLKEKITAMIPVETIGESEAIKNGGVLVVAYNEIEVKALPTDLPEKFEADITKLVNIADTVTVADLSYDRSKIEVLLNQEEVVATVQAQEEEIVEEAPTEPVEVELTKQGATKEEEVSEEKVEKAE